ncbi:ribonuclease D [Methyloparacoccus murrellii]
MTSSPAPQLIEHDDALNQLVERLGPLPAFALDTEFVRERTYYPAFCLLQIATDDLVACVDPLRLRSLEPLRALLMDPRIVKVVHSGRQDMEVLLRYFGQLPRNLCDTQMAAGLAGHAEQCGYASLVERLFGHRLPKTHTRTDWSRRPLSPEQIQYAGEDVAYLLPAYRRLETELSEQGRWDWVRQDSEALLDPGLYDMSPELAWKRVASAQPLTGAALVRFKALATWRERSAQRLDIPRNWILRDETLHELTLSRQGKDAELPRARGIGNAAQQQLLKELRVVLADHPCPPLEVPLSNWPRPDPAQKALMAKMTGEVRRIAEQLGIAPALLASRRDLEQLLENPASSRLLKGWRHEIVGLPLRRIVGNTATETGHG